MASDPTAEPYIVDDICSNCNQPWSDHFGDLCPEQDPDGLTDKKFEQKKEC